jgi:hypothetical protein
VRFTIKTQQDSIIVARFLTIRLDTDQSHEFQRRLKVGYRKLTHYQSGSEIAAKQGPVLASAESGNGPGVDVCPALYLQNAGIGATLSFIF